ncbi:tyrosine-type recombinase/integrase [Epilithonimonas hispanica]|uniref:Integrase/recombinase XerD n=1 Tax=Epilithonimonas hispanica TaxID=358687 RepID=A0A3D9CZB1_9FLAO|nr:tyrosine-type recombinase/integrase [Epilithonimonas hispanica]REC71102.1 hypothetical protein DRF58_07570 [Epilithonimonas hispanica]REC71107.1 hypothetical protein DRF58_07595 [Epilithonimonas hispanica]
MKKLPLNNAGYQHLLKAFEEWLDILGYAQGTVYNLPNYNREFLYLLEQNNVRQLTNIDHKHIKNYHSHLLSRTNEREGGALSSNYINGHLFALEKFFEFLRHKGVKNLPEINIRRLEIEKFKREILTIGEIKELYKVIDEQECITPKQEALNYQDRVLLAIYYGCGLRNSEGRTLCLEDINLDTQILHVKKGKGNKQRLIPFNNAVKECLKIWMYEYRMILLKDKTESRLLISSLGKPIAGCTLGNRLKRLIAQSSNIKLKEKNITLHSLRHSIATHLLAGGMDIQKVQKFLGHSCLDTTEIYTHLIEEV